jgi:hypothetical protein
MAEDALNDQIADAVAQINRTIGEASESQARAMADQVMAHAISLAMQNAVAQQQQAYILRNAVTTAAARAILESSPEDALRFAREVLSSDDVAQTLERLGELMGGAHARKPKKGG